jgi:glycerol kinase
VLILDETLRLVGRGYREFAQHYPQPGWVEHDPEEIWASVLARSAQALGQAGCEPSSIAAIGITNQRETTVLWDRKTGKPVHRAIVWQDRRTAETLRRAQGAGHEANVRARTGLTLDPYFSGTKIAWLLAQRRGSPPPRTRASSRSARSTATCCGG